MDWIWEIMKIGILCQEEPLFLGPCLQKIIGTNPQKVAAVFIAGQRTGGEKHKTPEQKKKSLLTYWHVFEPYWFFLNGLIKARALLLGEFDPRSLEGTARKWNIPVYHVSDPNSAEFRKLLAELELDTVLNQTELLLKKEVLSIPAKGFVNRHASLLPYYRGRFASFWAHAAKEPSYGVTIHFVDEGIDSGDIILQQEFPEIDPCRSYTEVMNHIQEQAPALFWRAMALIEDDSFVPTPNEPIDEPYLFPTLADAYDYRATMERRRTRARRKVKKKSTPTPPNTEGSQKQ